MSTTVIASRHGASLYLAPWQASDLDLAEITRVAEQHGVELFDAERLATKNEAIVAAGLPPAEASRLASALEHTGLTVRVVNDATISQSARLSNALFVLILVAVLTSPLVIPAILALINAVVIGMGGLSLQVVGAPSKRPPTAVRVLEELRALDDQLPSHVLDPLVAQATTLAGEAALDPEGPAAQALQELLTDLQEDREVETAQTGRSLRQELARARRAARELG